MHPLLDSATNTQVAYHVYYRLEFRIWDVRYGYVLFIGTRTLGENNPVPANERPVVYILKQLQKKPL